MRKIKREKLKSPVSGIKRDVTTDPIVIKSYREYINNFMFINSIVEKKCFLEKNRLQKHNQDGLTKSQVL